MALDVKTESGSISRRTIIKGAAWSAPVMVAAVAIPAAAATTHPTSATPSPVALVAGLQTVTFTLSPVPPASTSVTVNLTGATYADGSATTAVTTDASGKLTVTVQPTSATGSFNLSGLGWGPILISFAASFPTSSTPSSYRFTSGSDTTVSLTLSPAPAAGTIVSVALPAGYSFSPAGTNPRNFTVGTGGVISPVIKATGSAAPGNLTVTGTGGWSVTVGLSR